MHPQLTLDDEQTRSCWKCGAETRLSDFPPNGRYRLTYCRACKRKDRRNYYATVREKVRPVQSAYAKRRWAQLRADVLAAYGARCACCAEDEPDFLCIDHINGGGRKHREEVGSQMYLWLKRNGYPDGFQTLCFNCNHGKERPGGCPHQR